MVLVITAMLGAGLIINAKQTNGIANVIEAGARGGSGVSDIAYIMYGMINDIHVRSCFSAMSSTSTYLLARLTSRGS